ncbi:MAG: hypothetical protein IAE89_09315 [Anaerolineae bacterium]|nr:hypothetical protein [Anaerolineae bacterium]
MQNIAPKRVISRRANQLYTIAFLMGSGGIFAIAMGILMILLPLDIPANPSYALYALVRGALIGIGALLLIGAIILAARAATFRKDNDLAMITGRYLEPLLDNNFTYIRNINKRSIGYVDAALIGPPGIMVFRIVDNTGAYINEGANWLKRAGSGEWIPAGFSPTREDIADIRKVREFLIKREIGDVPIFGMVVFTPDPQRVGLTIRNPEIPVTHLMNLYPALQNGYLTSPPLDANQVVAITRSLLS